MKKHFFFFLVAALVLGLTTDCSSDSLFGGEDPIYDYAPLVISVKVLDQNGNSFVNSHTAEYFTAIYKGETYPCKAARELTQDSAVTRYYLPHFYGLSYVNDYLVFGELAGEKTYVDEQLVICFSGTRKDTITFSHRLENHAFVESFRLNGQPVEGQIVLHYEVTPPVEENDTTPRKEMPVTAEQRRLIEGCNAFSMNLFRHLLAESADASLVSSPLSVAYLLGMLANGVTDGNPVQTELLHCLWEGNNDDLSDHTWHGDVSRFNELFQTLISWAPQVDSRVTLELADALFINTGFPVYAGYVDLLARYYQADYAELNFSSPEALAYINSWASQKTHGLIPTILEEIPENVLAYLFNALYFKAPWATAFDPQMTAEAPFTLPDGSQRPMQMMRQELETQTAKTETYRAVSVPFAKGAIVAMVLWPGITEITEITEKTEKTEITERTERTESVPQSAAGRPLQGRVSHNDNHPEVLATLVPPAIERRRFQRQEATANEEATADEETTANEEATADEETTANKEATADKEATAYEEATAPKENTLPINGVTTTHKTTAVVRSNPLPTPQPVGRSPRLLALSVHTAGFGGGNSGTNPMAAQSDYHNTQKPSNYYFIAGNGYTFANYAGVRAAQQSLNNNAVTIDNHHHDLPLTLGLSLNVPLSERWSLESGVTYTLLRSTFDYGNEQNYSHQLQRINYLGIPLQVQYALISSRAVRLYALAGLQVDFPLSIKQEWQQITNGRLTKEETTSPFALVPVQFSSIAGLGAQLNVTRHLSVFCEPSVQWFVPASEPVGGSRPQTWRTEHELVFSIPFGLRWTF